MDEVKAEWTTAYINDLPDSAFLYIEPGHEKDETGRTVPRSARHFPYRDASGKIDLPHLRNAIARIPQSNAPGLTPEKKRQLQEKARAILERAQQGKAIELKATDDGRMLIGGYAVMWGGTDLVGDYFTPETDFWFDKITDKPPVLYQHGKDEALKAAPVGRTTRMLKDEVGLWLEAQLELSEEYREAISELLAAGALGYSTGAAGHLVERLPTEKGNWLKSWPVVEVSLTPTPAEPRTLGVAEIKSLGIELPGELVQEAAHGGAADDGEQVDEAKAAAVETEKPEENTMEIKEIEKALAELSAKLDTVLTEPPVKAVPPAVPQKDDETKSFADFLQAVWRHDEGRLKSYATKAALSGAAGTTGGYLIPPQFSADIIAAAGENAVAWPLAERYRVHGPLTMPALDLSSGAAGTPAWYGGVKMYWHEEGLAPPESEPSFDQIQLHDHGLGAVAYVSNRLLSATPQNVDAQLRNMFAKALGWYIDWYVFRGDGAGKPLGILNAPCLVSYSRASANDFTFADAVGMMSRMLPGSFDRAVWFMHPTVLPKALAFTVGQQAVWVTDATQRLRLSIFDRPIYVTEKLPALGTTGDVVLADMSYYALLMPDDIEVAVSEHYKFINDQTTFRVNAWVDGEPTLKTTATLADGSTTVSAFVALA